MIFDGGNIDFYPIVLLGDDIGLTGIIVVIKIIVKEVFIQAKIVVSN